jgi:DNA-directed RNA polymerase subunit RPC12/RpoP
MKDYKCSCGFEFAKPGEFRNCQAFITKEGDSGVICPKCGNKYVTKEDFE